MLEKRLSILMKKNMLQTSMIKALFPLLCNLLSTGLATNDVLSLSHTVQNGEERTIRQLSTSAATITCVPREEELIGFF